MSDGENKVAPEPEPSTEMTEPEPKASTVTARETGSSASESMPASPANSQSVPGLGGRRSERYIAVDGDHTKPVPRDRPVPTGVNCTAHGTIEGKYYVDDISLVRDQIVVPLYADQGGYYVYRAQVNKQGSK